LRQGFQSSDHQINISTLVLKSKLEA
jgi:hypothetical protein